MPLGAIKTRRKSISKATVIISLIMIISGLFIRQYPAFAIDNQQSIYYLYPYETNNPVKPEGLFWWEAQPQLGAMNLTNWQNVFGNELVVIGLPEDKGYRLDINTLGNNLGNWLVYRLKNKLRNNLNKNVKPLSPPPSPRDDSFVYKRKVGNTSEEIKVPRKLIEDHFVGNDNFDKFMDTVKKNLTSDQLIRDINKNKEPKTDKKTSQVNYPIPAPDHKEQTQQLQFLGNTLILSGTAMFLLKLIPLLAF